MWKTFLNKLLTVYIVLFICIHSKNTKKKKNRKSHASISATMDNPPCYDYACDLRSQNNNTPQNKK